MPTERSGLWPAALLLLAWTGAAADLTISEGTNIAADVAPDGSVYMDLLDGLWRIPPGGGTAMRLPNQTHRAHMPRLHAGRGAIAYVAERQRQTELWLYDTAAERATPVAARWQNYKQPDWHPDGERLVFAADADGRGFALWELDIATGLRWRLTHGPGEATWPAWSPDGRDLVYVRRIGDRYELVLRRRALPEEVLLISETPLSAPSFRPDKSLVTVLRHVDPVRIDMVILAEPRLVRPLVEDEDIFVARVAWMDRHRLVYTGNGRVRQRLFNAWTSSNVAFRASLEAPPLAPAGTPGAGRRVDAPPSTARAAVVRASRLFDGLSRDYREDVDILMRDGRIAAVEAQRPRPGETVIDLGDITVLPGLIDVYAELPQPFDGRVGAELLSFGVTTLAAAEPDARAVSSAWGARTSPGPLLLEAAPLDEDRSERPPPWLYLLGNGDQSGATPRQAVARAVEAGIPVLAVDPEAGLLAGATLMLGGEALPVSPAGRRYADQTVSNGRHSVTLVSSLAHRGTRGIDQLFRRRTDRFEAGDGRRLAAEPALSPGLSRVVLGSAGNRLPPGLAQHAELLAMVEAGLEPYHALKAATVDAALALGLGLRAGRVAPGATADLILVDGDPLTDIRDIHRVVGVVRNGLFLSTGRLTELAAGD